MALTTASLVKSYLNESGSGADTIIASIVAAVEARILGELGRLRIETGTVTDEYQDGDGRSDILILREWPATVITSVSWWNGTTATALAATDYALQSAAQDSAGLLVYTPGGGYPAAWPCGRRNVRITYTAGYSAVPADLQLAATIQCVWDLKRTGHAGGRLGERNQIIGDGQATYMVDAWAPEVAEVLARYRRTHV